MENLRKNIWGSWRETSRNRSQFLQRRNLKKRIMSELKIIDFIYFILFLFIFLFLDLELGVSMMSHFMVTVTQSHITQKNIKNSKTITLYNIFTTCWSYKLHIMFGIY